MDKTEEEAAARIQALQRGRLARLSVDRRRRSLIRREATARWEREQAAIKIQVIEYITKMFAKHSDTTDARYYCLVSKYLVRVSILQLNEIHSFALFRGCGIIAGSVPE